MDAVKDKDAFLKECRDRLQLAIDADQDNRTEAFDDLRVLSGLDHWPKDIKQDRDARNRASLVVNQLPQFLRQVTGDIRSMNPSIKIVAGDSAANPRIAEVYEGIIRHIQNKSDASSVYERAAESAAACGMGYFRLLADYEHDGSFNQEITIRSIMNPFSVYFDPDAVLPTREDAAWCFITQAMDEDAFRKEYPDAAAEPVDADINDSLASWRDGKSVTVAEYFWIEKTPVKAYLLNDGTTLVDPDKEPGKRKVLKTRDTVKRRVMWAKVSAGDILEGPQETVWEHLPVIAVMGEELYAGDRIYRSSVIRHAKDPQRIFNMTWSSAVESIALQSRSPWMATPANIAGFEDQWKDPDAITTALLANPDPQTGQLPMRQTPPLASSGLADLLNRSAMELRSTTGIQDAALGRKSSESSGIAIRQRQQESDNSTSIYADNTGKAIAHCGRAIVAAVPRVMDTERVVRIIGKDGEAALQPVNTVVQTDQGPVMFDLATGRYEVEVEVGPNHATRMQAASESMMQFASAAPNLLPFFADLLVKNMDWPGAADVAERLKAALPPGVQPDQQPSPQQAQAMQQQQMMQAQQMEAARIMQELEIRVQVAKAQEAEAQAVEAQAKAQKALIEAGAAGMMPAPMPQA